MRFSRSMLTAALAGTGGLLLGSFGIPAIFRAPTAVDRTSGGDETLQIDSPRVAALPSAGRHRPPLAVREVARRGLAIAASVQGDHVYGSGIVVDKRGYLLTNRHVVHAVKNLHASLSDGIEFPVEIADEDEDLDLALLHADRTFADAAAPGEILDLAPGDDLFAVGCPRKMSFSVTRGTTSFVGRKIDGQYFLQSSIATNDGSSGGPVLNDRGEVVGVMSFILRDSQGLSFAVPIDAAWARFGDVLDRDRFDTARWRSWLEDQD